MLSIRESVRHLTRGPEGGHMLLFADKCGIILSNGRTEGIHMLYTKQTKKAMKLCFSAHKDQVDKSGMPYVFHPIHLAEQMTDEDTTVAALLHDVVEDTEYTIEDLAAMGFNDRIIAAINLMTHTDGVPYMDYVAKIKDNPIAKAVKLADLAHNSDITRLDVIDDKALERVEKYREAIRLLND